MRDKLPVPSPPIRNTNSSLPSFNPTFALPSQCPGGAAVSLELIREGRDHHRGGCVARTRSPDAGVVAAGNGDSRSGESARGGGRCRAPPGDVPAPSRSRGEAPPVAAAAALGRVEAGRRARVVVGASRGARVAAVRGAKDVDESRITETADASQTSQSQSGGKVRWGGIRRSISAPRERASSQPNNALSMTPSRVLRFVRRGSGPKSERIHGSADCELVRFDGNTSKKSPEFFQNGEQSRRADRHRLDGANERTRQLVASKAVAGKSHRGRGLGQGEFNSIIRRPSTRNMSSHVQLGVALQRQPLEASFDLRSKHTEATKKRLVTEDSIERAQNALTGFNMANQRRITGSSDTADQRGGAGQGTEPKYVSDLAINEAYAMKTVLSQKHCVEMDESVTKTVVSAEAARSLVESVVTDYVKFRNDADDASDNTHSVTRKKVGNATHTSEKYLVQAVVDEYVSRQQDILSDIVFQTSICSKISDLTQSTTASSTDQDEPNGHPGVESCPRQDVGLHSLFEWSN